MITNAAILLARLAIGLLLALWSSRVLLEVLGFEVFGFFNVLVGLLMIFGFLHGALTSSFQRYLSFYSREEQMTIFGSSLIIAVFVVAFLCVVVLFVGLWMMEGILTLPSGLSYSNMTRAYFYLIGSFVFFMMQVPFLAYLIAEERVVSYSAITLLDALLKLISSVMIDADYFVVGTLLESYSILYFLSAVLVFLVCAAIVHRSIKKTKRKVSFNFSNGKEMLRNISWNTIGNLASSLSVHGGNVLINVYFSPVYNASRSLATQLSGVVSSAASSVQMAIGPSIVRLYADKNKEGYLAVVVRVSRYIACASIILYWVMFEYSEHIMDLWLGSYPRYAPVFFKYAMIVTFVDAVAIPLMLLAQATGNIKLYQLKVGGVLLLGFPISWGLLEMGFAADSVYFVAIGASLAATVVRIAVLKDLASFDIRRYLAGVMPRVLLTLIYSFLLFHSVGFLVETHWLWRVVVYFVIAFPMSVFVEMSTEERKSLSSKIERLVNAKT